MHVTVLVGIGIMRVQRRGIDLHLRFRLKGMKKGFLYG